MIPAQFDYARANTLDEALNLLAQNEDAKVLAGGHSLIPAMKLRLAMPSMLVDIARIKDLSYISDDDALPNRIFGSPEERLSVVARVRLSHWRHAGAEQRYDWWESGAFRSCG